MDRHAVRRRHRRRRRANAAARCRRTAPCTSSPKSPRPSTTPTPTRWCTATSSLPTSCCRAPSARRASVVGRLRYCPRARRHRADGDGRRARDGGLRGPRGAGGRAVRRPLRHLLTGLHAVPTADRPRPFPGTNGMAAVMLAHMQQPPPRVTDLVPTLPPPWTPSSRSPWRRTRPPASRLRPRSRRRRPTRCRIRTRCSERLRHRRFQVRPRCGRGLHAGAGPRSSAPSPRWPCWSSAPLR